MFIYINMYLYIYIYVYVCVHMNIERVCVCSRDSASKPVRHECEIEMMCALLINIDIYV